MSSKPSRNGAARRRWRWRWRRRRWRWRRWRRWRRWWRWRRWRRRAAGTARVLEGADPGPPLRVPRRLDVLVREPEGAVVDRVGRDHRVVAPAARAVGLRARAGVKRRLYLRELVRRVGREPAHVLDGRVVGRGRVRGREADRHVPVLVHGRAPHPAMETVGRRVRALLVDGPVPARLLQVVPADPGAVGTDVDRVVDDEPLLATEVPVGKPVHEAVAKRVQPLGRARLRHARREAAEDPVEGRHGEDALVRHGHHRRGGSEVDGRVPDVQAVNREVRRVPLVVVDLDHRRGRVRRRLSRPVGVRREHAAPEGRCFGEHVPVGHLRGLAGEHLVALEGQDADAAPAEARHDELVDRAHVGVLSRPDAELRVVVQLVRRDQVLVAVPGPRGVVRGRDGDALVERPGVRKFANANCEANQRPAYWS